jgi:hypothetical protein
MMSALTTNGKLVMSIILRMEIVIILLGAVPVSRIASRHGCAISVGTHLDLALDASFYGRVVRPTPSSPN